MNELIKYSKNEIKSISDLFSGKEFAYMQQINVFGHIDHIHYKYDDSGCPPGPSTYEVEREYRDMVEWVKTKSKKSFNAKFELPPIEDGIIWGPRGSLLSIDLLPEYLIGLELATDPGDIFGTSLYGNMLSVHILAPKLEKLEEYLFQYALSLSSSCMGYWDKSKPVEKLSNLEPDKLLEKLILQTVTGKQYLKRKSKLNS